MATVPRLLVDCSVVVKWRLTSESHAFEAGELLSDWENGAVRLCVPDQFFGELVNALIGATRKHPPRLTAAEARDTLDDLTAAPFLVFKTTGRKILAQAFDIAQQFSQQAYDCLYVALAERKRIEFWTGDERLYNALHTAFPFVRWIAHYQRKRP